MDKKLRLTTQIIIVIIIVLITIMGASAFTISNATIKTTGNNITLYVYDEVNITTITATNTSIKIVDYYFVYDITNKSTGFEYITKTNGFYNYTFSGGNNEFQLLDSGVRPTPIGSSGGGGVSDQPTVYKLKEIRVLNKEELYISKFQNLTVDFIILDENNDTVKADIVTVKLLRNGTVVDKQNLVSFSDNVYNYDVYYAVGTNDYEDYYELQLIGIKNSLAVTKVIALPVHRGIVVQQLSLATIVEKSLDVVKTVQTFLESKASYNQIAGILLLLITLILGLIIWKKIK